MVYLNEIFESIKHIKYGFYHQKVDTTPPLIQYLQDLYKGNIDCNYLPNYIDDFCNSYIYNKQLLSQLISDNLNLYADENSTCHKRLYTLSKLFQTYSDIEELMPLITFTTQIVNFALAEDTDDLIDLNKQLLKKTLLDKNDLLVIVHNPSLIDLDSKFIYESLNNDKTEIGKLLLKWLKDRDEYTRLKIIVTLQNQILTKFDNLFLDYTDNLSEIYTYIDSEEIYYSNKLILPSDFYQKIINNLPIQKCYNLTRKQFVQMLQIFVVYVNNAYITFNIEELNELLHNNQIEVGYIQSILTQWLFIENSQLQFNDIIETSLEIALEIGLSDDELPDNFSLPETDEETINQLISDIQNEMNAISDLVNVIQHTNDITDGQKDDLIKRKDVIYQKLHLLNLKTKNIYNKILSIQEKIYAFQQSLIRPFAIIGNKYTTKLKDFLSVMQDKVSLVKDFFSNVSDTAQQYIDEVKGMIENLGNSVLAILDIINPNNFVANLLTMLTTPFEALLATLNQIVCAIKAILCFIVSVIKGVIKTLTNLDKLIQFEGVDTWSTFTDKVKETFSNNTNDVYSNLMKGYNSNLTATLAGSVHQKLGADKAKEFKEEADKVFEQCLNDNSSNIGNIIKTQAETAFNTLKSHAETAIDNILALKEALNCKPYDFGNIKLDLSLNFNVPHFELPKLDSSKFACIGDNDGV